MPLLKAVRLQGVAPVPVRVQVPERWAARRPQVLARAPPRLELEAAWRAPVPAVRPLQEAQSKV